MTDIYALKYIEFYDTRRREAVRGHAEAERPVEPGVKELQQGIAEKKHCA